MFPPQVHIKDVQKCSNIKEKWLCLVRQHTRRHLVDGMLGVSYFDHDNDLGENDNPFSRSGKDYQEDSHACDIGLRYPVLQVARRRENLRMLLNVCLVDLSTH